ncbi:MAG: DUF4180 domain-containing protein [Candidatus Gracilibacteria bacterium]
MNTIFHEKDNGKIAEITSEAIIVNSSRDAIDLMMDFSGEGIYKVILYQKNMTPDFFDLKTKLAGDIMQKMVNYDLHAAIIGDFSNVESESLNAFIFECNKGKHLFFVNTIETGIELLNR